MMVCLVSNIFNFRIEICSRMWEASLVLDGGSSFQFNDGAIATLEMFDEDALRTVQFHWNSDKILDGSDEKVFQCSRIICIMWFSMWQIIWISVWQTFQMTCHIENHIVSGRTCSMVWK